MSNHKFFAANGTTLCVYSPNEVLARGFQLVGPAESQDIDHETKAFWFKSFFGADHNVASQVWFDLQTAESACPPLNVEEDGTCIDDFFLALFFLKSYKKGVNNEMILKKSTTTIRKWAAFHSLRISNLTCHKICWPEEEGEVITIGTIHCPATCCTKHQIEHPGRRYHSNRTRSHAFAYEIAISSYESKVVWKNGPFPAGLPDANIHETRGLRSKMVSTDAIGVGGSSYQPDGEPGPTLRAAEPNDPHPELKLMMLRRLENSLIS